MRGSSHLAIGLITGVAIAGLVPGLPFSLPGIALAGFSSLAPDLDHPDSRLSKRLGFSQNYVRWAFAAGALALAAFACRQGAQDQSGCGCRCDCSAERPEWRAPRDVVLAVAG